MNTDERLAVLEAQMAEMRDDMKSVLAVLTAGAGMWKFILGLAALVSSVSFAISNFWHWKP